MPLWTCDIPKCGWPAIRDLGDCVICDRHLCASHLNREFHVCAKLKDENARRTATLEAEERELNQLIGKIDTRALKDRASKHRLGLPCSIPPLKYDRETRNLFLGNTNYSFEIQFDDGITWIVRVRRQNARTPPSALRDEIMKNEVATLLYLEDTMIPAPRFCDFALETDPGNHVGVGFILIEKLPGTLMDWKTADETQRMAVMSGLANVYIELQNSPFTLLGSLDRPGTDRVGPLSLPELTDFVKGEMRSNGPFPSMEQYHEASLRHILNNILKGEMYRESPVDAYIIHLFLLDLIPLLVPSVGVDGVFHLMHSNNLDQHILVDQHYNITGIIGWQHAHTAPAGTVLCSLTALLPSSVYYGGGNDLSDDEETFAQILESRGHQDIAEHVRRSRLHQRFASCCGYDLRDWNGFLRQFQGLRDAANVDEGLDWEAWKAIALERYHDEYGLEGLQTRERNV